MTGANRYELPPDAVLQVADGEAILAKLNEEDMYALNQTGAEIVQRLADGFTIEAVVDDLAEAYGAARTDVARDVLALVGELVERGLLIGRADP